MFKLRCPRCRKTMLYHKLKKLKNSSTILPDKQIKKCVYCNKSFKVKDNLIQIITEKNKQNSDGEINTKINAAKPAIFVHYGVEL